MVAKTEVETIQLKYELFELPTPQHKAGLAGFVLLLESLRLRKVSPLPEISLTATTAEITFTEESMQVIFDDIYDAQEVKVESRSKWKGKEPLDVVERIVKDRSGKEKKQKYFVYESIQPRGAFLETYFPDGDGQWLKLWRDMLWRILRGIPATRKVYEERAEGKPSSLANETWVELGKARKDAESNKLRSSSISSSLYLGAQDVNGERVKFRGRVEHNFLLHFWTIVALLFDARSVKLDGDTDDCGFVIVIPEPAHLEYFTEEIARLLRELDTTKAGYRPRAALIHIPEEGGLEYLYHLARHRTGQHDLSDCIVAVEVLQMQKQGNNVRALAAERIEPRQHLLDQYEVIRTGCWNPFFRSLRIRNLLRDELWFTNATELFANYPWEFFIQSIGKTPGRLPFYGADVMRKFRGIESDLQQRKATTMSVGDRDNELSRRIYRVIRQYVSKRSEEKSGHSFEDFKAGKGGKAYRDAREAVARDAFLAMRGRRAEDFVEYFTGSICAVPHFLPEEEYLAVTDALLHDTDRVKTLSMLALSATSYLSEPKKDEGGSK
jgi:CRISPR-associated protein Cmx8